MTSVYIVYTYVETYSAHNARINFHYWTCLNAYIFTIYRYTITKAMAIIIARLFEWLAGIENLDTITLSIIIIRIICAGIACVGGGSTVPFDVRQSKAVCERKETIFGLSHIWQNDAFVMSIDECACARLCGRWTVCRRRRARYRLAWANNRTCNQIHNTYTTMSDADDGSTIL